MNKIFFTTLLVAVIVAFAGYNLHQSQKTINLSDLIMDNIEAFAADETACGNSPDKNNGACKKKVDGTGYTCVDPGFWDSKDCYKEINQ